MSDSKQVQPTIFLNWLDENLMNGKSGKLLC